MICDFGVSSWMVVSVASASLGTACEVLRVFEACLSRLNLGGISIVSTGWSFSSAESDGLSIYGSESRVSALVDMDVELAEDGKDTEFASSPDTEGLCNSDLSGG